MSFRAIEPASFPWYDYKGNEIDDVDLYRYQDNVMRIQNKDFNCLF